MIKLIIPAALAALIATACSDDDSGPAAPSNNKVLEFEYTFAASDEGFSSGFADYPSGEEGFYGLDFEYKSLPDNFHPERKGLFITGNNHSDDLFMFIKRRLGSAEGIKPNVVYFLSLTVEFATSAGSGCAGIGGAPGESVYMKAGAAAIEPLAVNTKSFYEMNIDKGQQASGGPDALVIGHIGNNSGDCSGRTWEFKTLELPEFAVKTGDNGELWVIIGTDSGFEGVTRLYYTNVRLTLVGTSLNNLPGIK
ncbi:MAG TPA: hypothetical protein VM123_04115 [archaeon]|nr:hypothetical protein [archaeon]